MKVLLNNCEHKLIIPTERSSRILKSGGRLLSGTDHFVNYLVDETEERIVNPLPFNPLKNLDQMAQLRESDSGVLFSHTITEQIGGQLRAGFTLLDIYEDTNGTGHLRYGI